MEINLKVNSFATIVPFQRYSVVNFYSIKSEDKDLSEADDFFQRMSENNGIEDQLERLVYWMEQLGDGAIDVEDLRHEGICQALPPDRRVTNEFIELRLYCHIISDKVIILFNGDIKTAMKAKDCPNVGPHHRRATAWASKLDKEKIEIDHNIIKNLDEILLTY